MNSHGSRERSRERSTSPFEVGTQSLLEGEIQDLHQMMEAGPDLHSLLEESIQTPFGKDK